MAYEGMEKFFPKSKIVMTGNPVREETTNVKGKRVEAFKFFSLNPDKKTILVTGGSLGARTINESIEIIIPELLKNDYQLIWQTGRLYAERAKGFVALTNSKNIVAFDFINRMDYAYAAADVVISRAGASSVSEIALVAKPAILVPSPNVAEDHQTKNAMSLVEKNAAVLVTDDECRNNLMNVVLQVLNDEQRQQMLKSNIAKLSVRDSASRIVDEVYKIVTDKSKTN